MPLLPIPDNIVKIEVIYDINGLEAVNVLHAEALSGPSTQGELDAMLADFQTAWVANIIPRLWSNAVVTEYRASEYQGGLAAVQSMIPASDAGTVVAEEPAPPNVAVVLSWRTAVGGRQNRGRTYLPSVPIQWIQDSGQLDPTERAAYQTAGNDLIADLATAWAATFTFGVFSRPTWDPPRPASASPLRPADPDPARPGHLSAIFTCFVDSTVDTQRGRLRN